MKKAALISAFVAGLIGFAMVYAYMRQFEAEASGGPPIAVLMATEDIPLGSTLTEDMLGVRNLPTAYIDARHVRASDAGRVVGVRVSMEVRAGESLLWTDLATSAQERSLSGLVRPGMRAVTFRAGVSSGFGGLLRPGDRVDVFLTTTREGAERDAPEVTLPLLQNVLVLAVGADTGSEDLADLEASVNGPHNTVGGSYTRQSEVTFSTTVEQGAMLTHAASSGRLSLALRNPDDVAILDGLPETTQADFLEPERRARLMRREPHQEPSMPVRLGVGGH